MGLGLLLTFKIEIFVKIALFVLFVRCFLTLSPFISLMLSCVLVKYNSILFRQANVISM